MLLPELREEVAKVGKEARRLPRTKGRSGGDQRKRLPEAPLWAAYLPLLHRSQIVDLCHHLSNFIFQSLDVINKFLFSSTNV